MYIGRQSETEQPTEHDDRGDEANANVNEAVWPSEKDDERNRRWEGRSDSNPDVPASP